ncbi:hypothetical protein J5N97_014149 [Dioscorea zingiberensis]|uniref:Uncharacterized protein n=1 Tax=Dioscorea zingiberensis TaxID=325984 RepID=A0A9D5HJ82_9LILI|nr:hypothetical protein J5N97_014149 [Dioscorea zingiberensis]
MGVKESRNTFQRQICAPGFSDLKTMAASTSFRFLKGESIMELWRSEEAQWTVHCYTTEGWTVIDWGILPEIDRMVFVTTSHDRVAVVELWPEVKATVLETDMGINSFNGQVVQLHFADVYDDEKEEIYMVILRVEDRKVMNLML